MNSCLAGLSRLSTCGIDDNLCLDIPLLAGEPVSHCGTSDNLLHAPILLTDLHTQIIYIIASLDTALVKATRTELTFSLRSPIAST